MASTLSAVMASTKTSEQVQRAARACASTRGRRRPSRSASASVVDGGHRSLLGRSSSRIEVMLSASSSTPDERHPTSTPIGPGAIPRSEPRSQSRCVSRPAEQRRGDGHPAQLGLGRRERVAFAQGEVGAALPARSARQRSSRREWMRRARSRHPRPARDATAGRPSRVRKTAAAIAAHGSSGETGASEPKSRFAPGVGERAQRVRLRGLLGPDRVGDVAVVDRVLGLHARADAEAGESRDVGVRDELRVLDRADRAGRARTRRARASSRRRRSRGSRTTRPAPVARGHQLDERRRGRRSSTP